MIMKKSISIIAIALMASVAMMTACTKEENGRKFTFSIQNPVGSKTTIGDGHSTLWQNGDVVYINGTSLEIQVDGQNVYSTNNTIQSLSDGKYYAFYAGRAVMGTQQVSDAGASYTYTLSNSYEIKSSELQAPMAAVATDGSATNVHINFQNLCSLMDVAVGRAACKIVISEQDSTNDPDIVPLSGTFTTTYTNGEWQTVCDKTQPHSYSLTIYKKDATSTLSIPFPAGKHKLRVTIVGTSYDQGQDSPYTYKASHYYDLNLTVPDDPFQGFDWGKGNFYTYKIDNNGTDGWQQGDQSLFFLEPHQYDTTDFVSLSSEALTIVRSGYITWLAGSPSTINPQALNNNGSTQNTMDPHNYGFLIHNTSPDVYATDDWYCPTADQWKSAIGGFTNTGNNNHPVYTSSSTNARWAYVTITYTGHDNLQGHNNTYNNLKIGGLLFIPDNRVKHAVDITKVITTDLHWGTTYSYTTSNQHNRNKRIPNNAWSASVNVGANNEYPAGIPNLTVAQFEEWESVGAIFLPCCGLIWHTSGGGTDDLKGHGIYRTCDWAGGSTSWILYLDPAECPTIFESGGNDFPCDNGSAASVRLIYKQSTTTPSTNSKSWR